MVGVGPQKRIIFRRRGPRDILPKLGQLRRTQCRRRAASSASAGWADGLLDERTPPAGRLAHRSGTNQHPALRGYGWRVNHCATVTTRPSCVPAAGTHPVTDEHPARAEPVPARAVLGWPNHPSAISAAD
jgi:hypothetical protein